jgi:hypothetical protein
MRLRRNVWGGAFRNRLAAANEATKNIKIKIRQTTDATIGGRLRGRRRAASATAAALTAASAVATPPPPLLRCRANAVAALTTASAVAAPPSPSSSRCHCRRRTTPR